MATDVTTALKTVFFDLKEGADWQTSQRFGDQLEQCVIKVPPFYLLGMRFGPGLTIPRHRHNCAQLVLVLEGEIRQGNRRIPAGSGYVTPELIPYSVTAGPDGALAVEVRSEPFEGLETIWSGIEPGLEGATGGE